jgi:hypothetical protein
MVELALITQMRAGTHYMCGALRVSLEATLYRPVADGKYAVMTDAEIQDGLHQDSVSVLPKSRSDHIVYFSHYYHTQHHDLPAARRIYLIGFPYDSFYSDGIVYSDAAYSAGPSQGRAHADDYVLRFDSREWRHLSERMRQNAEWLGKIRYSGDGLIIRYEDIFDRFEISSNQLGEFVGGFTNPLPKPFINRRRTYWSDGFERGFDKLARAALWEMFGPAIEKFYPEKVISLRRSL